ncbi:MAG: hypothetical protein WCG98_05465 [bacterium]
MPHLGNSEDKISRLYDKEQLERKLLSIYDRKDNLSGLVKESYRKEWENARKKASLPLRKHVPNQATVAVDGDQILNYSFCPECTPEA